VNEDSVEPQGGDMTDEEEKNLIHTVEKTDDDLTRLQERVALLDAALKSKSAQLEELKRAAESELKKNWASIMHLVAAFETMPNWMDMRLVRSQFENSVAQFEQFKRSLEAIKKIYAGQ